MRNKKVALIIVDGWGIGRKDHTDAAYVAKTPFFDEILKNYPTGVLEASGLAVGLPSGQMGNSEVGHMNLGAGRIVYQELGRINKAIEDGTLGQNEALLNAFDYAKKNKKAVHFIGLVSDGGVHAHIEHLKALCQAAADQQVEQSFVHAFLDGRDTDPNGGLGYIRDLNNFLADKPTRLATLTGRYYAMDRDSRWERIKKAYDVMVHGIGQPWGDAEMAIQASYDGGVTDEFLKPVVIAPEGVPLTTIKPDDVVICFNFRTDRGREITAALTQNNYPEFGMHCMRLHYLTMTSYDDNFRDIKVMLHKDDLNLTLGEVLAQNNKSQIRIAETEKYPHVTFFFSGGREQPFQGEKRIMVPSPKVATYDLQPEMSADGIVAEITREMRAEHPDFICLNFANPDMVGHTGVFEAVVKAVETADRCTEIVVNTGLEEGYSFIILADHGNSEFMVNADGSPNTAHTTNLVPCVIIDEDVVRVNDGKLADVAPTVLKLMGIEKPEIMTGACLI